MKDRGVVLLRLQLSCLFLSLSVLISGDVFVYNFIIFDVSVCFIAVMGDEMHKNGKG